jgi:site-specific DNA-methyltransferase (adenine-specific)
MKPYYSEDGIEIYHGDCREVLPLIAAVDLVLTDPPYGIGDKMQGGTWGAAEKYADFRAWDKAPNPDLLTAIIAKAPVAIVWGGNYFPLPPSRGWLAWDKQNAVRTMSDVELAWTNQDRPAKRFSHPVAVHRYGHPSEKPLPLFLWCLGQFPGESVLDPFMGSGTTLEAAKVSGRTAIGIETNERYCEIAAKRLAQGVLFGAGGAA